ncbi:hypothetical protein ACFLSP_04715 [Bacteroidota bacterium]
MRKVIFILSLTVLSLASNAQQIDRLITKIGLSATVKYLIYDGDTSLVVKISFKDPSYESFTAVGNITLMDERIGEFAELFSEIANTELKQGETVFYDGGPWAIHKSSKELLLSVYSPNTKLIITKPVEIKLIEFLYKHSK